VTTASDWLDLTPVSTTGYTEDLTPTLNWKFDNLDDVQEVNLFISTFDEGEGLLPWDELVNLDDDSFLSGLSRQQKETLVTRDWNGYRDYNPGRILTATWKQSNNSWQLADGTVIASGNNSTFTLPDRLKLTAGATYHWAVRGVDSRGNSIHESGEFDTVAPVSTNPFSSVTILTHGFTPEPTPTGVPDEFYQLGNSIIRTSREPGLMLRYDAKTNKWIPIDDKGREISTNGQGLGTFIQNNYRGKSLVLLPSWSTESVIPNSGFSEAVADKFFAGLVSLDQMLGGGVGQINANGQTRIYDDFGNLISSQGDLFNSALHFIGFSRGTVVNSEIIQRLGTYFPHAGGRILGVLRTYGANLWLKPIISKAYS
jgi:large repetitive protein